MLTVRKVNSPGEKEIIKNFLKKENINDNFKNSDIIYVMEEDNKIIGVSKINRISNSSGILEYVFIIEERRGQNLGDGILRSILNYCDLNGIDRVYYPRVNKYLNKMGFSVIPKSSLPDNLKNHIYEDNCLVCNVKEFFSKGCGCKGR